MSEERDFVMARLAAARGHVSAAAEAIDGCISLFLWPIEDKDGSDRSDALDVACGAAGDLSRAVEAAQAILEGMNKKQLSEEEPDDEEELDDDDEGGKDAAEG
jgi:hypothetical protein